MTLKHILRGFFALLVIHLAAVSASAQMQLISLHQAWADSLYARPADMPEERLLQEATMAVYTDLQEESAANLLVVLSDRIPGLKDYYDFKKSGEADKLFANRIEALKAIADYAEKRYPGSFTAYNCRLRHIAAVPSLRDISKELSQFIGSLEKVVSKSSPAEMQALLCSARMYKLSNDLWFPDADNPLLYPEIFKLEKEALEIYPVSSKENTFVRADLYNILANLKSLPVNDSQAFMEHYLSGEVEGTQYSLIGTSRMYPCNSSSYFRLAAEIGEKVLNPGHPWVRDVNYSDISLRSNTLNPTEELLEAFRHHYNYTKYYYPSNSSQVAALRIANWITHLIVGERNSDELFLDSSLERLKEYFGEGSNFVRDNYINVASYKIFAGGGDDEWYDKALDAVADAGYAPESDYTLFIKAELNYPFLNILGDKAYDVITGITRRYLDNHSPSLLSVELGYKLASYYNGSISDPAMNIRLLETAISDLKKLAGKDSRYKSLIWDYSVDLVVARAKNAASKQEAIDILRKERESLLKDNFPQKSLALHFINQNLVGCLLDNGNFDEAFSLAKETLQNIEKSPDHYISAVGLMAFAGHRAGVSDEFMHAHTSRAIGLIDRIMREGYSGQINFLSPEDLTGYLFDEDRMDDALRLKQYEIDMYEALFIHNISQEYIKLKQDIATICFENGNINEGNRAMAEAAGLAQQAFGSNPTPQYVDFLWREYLAINPRMSKDTWTVSQHLNKIGEATFALYNASGQSDNIYYSYVARYLGEYLSVGSTFLKVIEEVPEHVEEISKEQLDAFFRNVEQVSEIYNSMAGMAKDMYARYHAEYPEYNKNPGYLNLTNGLASHYGLVEHDTLKAIEMRIDLIDGTLESADRLHSIMNVAWDYYQIGDTENTDKFLQKAETVYPDIASAHREDYLNYVMLKFYNDIAKGDYEHAAGYAGVLFEGQKQVLDGNFQLMTTSEQETYLNNIGDPAFPYAVLIEYQPGRLSREAYDAVLYRTGMQLRSQQATQDAIRRSDNPEVKQWLDSLNNLRAEIAGIDVTPDFVDMAGFNSRQNHIRVLSGRANELERRLLDATAHLRENALAEVTWDRVRDCLGPDEAAIEFIFSHNNLMALVVIKDYEAPKAVQLGSLTKLWQKTHPAGINNSAGLAKYLYENKDPELYAMLWQPLEDILKDARHIYFSAPGILSSLSFNAIATPYGDYLFDRYELTQLTTTGQLVFDNAVGKRPEKIAMMGDILYSPSQKPRKIDDPGVRDVDMDFNFDISGEDARKVVSNCFRHLPYTAVEIEEISALFPKNAVDTVRRYNATEKCLRKMAEGKPDIIHLATHGYYVDFSNQRLDKFPFFKKKGAGSMQRSGFALCGAEETWRGLSDLPDEEDGIVTAAEVASLDLKGTSLVALSACETALGDFSTEGVFGLQRGFKQAGVQSLLVSLWSVNDESTSLFMTEFYRSLLNGDDRRKAWRSAAESVRESYPSPYFWAPFILLD